MESKYTESLSSSFPENFGVRTNPKDPLRSLLNEVGIFKEKSIQEINRLNYSFNIEKFDPTTVSEVNYIDIPNKYNMNDILVFPDDNSGAILTEYENEFFSYKVTGFDFIESIIPSGLQPSTIYSSGTYFALGTYPDEGYFSENEFVYYNPDRILHEDFEVAVLTGISNGFDWDNPEFYITTKNSSDISIYTTFFDNPTFRDYSHKYQNFISQDKDEYLNILEEELLNTDIFPSGLEVGDIVKVAYTKQVPVSDIKIIDTVNLINPDNNDSPGIEIKSEDYTVNGNKIIFANLRSDYNPPSIDDKTEFILLEANTGVSTDVSKITDLSGKVELFNATNNFLALSELDIYKVLQTDSTHQSFFSTVDTFMEKLNKDEFSLILNGKFISQMLTESDKAYISLEFNTCTVHLGVLDNNIYIFVEYVNGDTYVNTIDNVLDITDNFGYITLIYNFNKLTVKVNNEELLVIDIILDISFFSNISFGWAYEALLSDIIFVKHALTSIENTFLVDILDTKNSIYNGIESELSYKNLDFPYMLETKVGPYQPDPGFNSSYIIEYKYKNLPDPTYITTSLKRFNVPLKSDIISNT